MVKTRPKKIFFYIRTYAGMKIRVSVQKKWSFSRELDYRTDHFEFRGKMNDTGYRSHFALLDVDEEYDHVKKAKEIMKNIYRLDFDGERPAQMDLFA